MKHLTFTICFILPSVMVSSMHQQIDCVDIKRKLRCVLRENCPARRVETLKTCPSGRVCCRKHKSNPYLPLRTLAIDNTTPLIAVKNRIYEDNDRFVFPSEMEYLQYETVSSTPKNVEIKKKEISKHTRESKSEDSMNFMHTNENELPPRKSVLACQLYTNISVGYMHFMPLLPNAKPNKVAVDKCEPRLNPLIVGGEPASIKDYPHMAALGYNKSEGIDYLCGGTLISENFVMTAAHCAKTKWGPPLKVHIGSTELYSNEAVISGVKEVIIHPQYKPPSCYNDIALLRLSNTLTLSIFLRPACLPTPETEKHSNSHTVVATGWGKTGFGRESSINLLKVALKIMKNQECGDYYKGETGSQALSKGINSNLICASGYKDLHDDTCQGDSGGPLQAPLADHVCMSQVVGITSFGKLCGAGIPAVYTRVLPYISWIEGIVW